jgi:hypothetical protein
MEKGGGVMKRLIETDPAGERGVHLSDCGKYRYRLWRAWDSSRPTLAFLMLNPSIADHLVDDPTITRCFARAVPDPLGPRNRANRAILEAVDRASMVICAWGSHKAAAVRAPEVMHLLRIVSMGANLFHLGINIDGSPKHPLYVSASRRPNQFMWGHS